MVIARLALLRGSGEVVAGLRGVARFHTNAMWQAANAKVATTTAALRNGCATLVGPASQPVTRSTTANAAPIPRKKVNRTRGITMPAAPEILRRLSPYHSETRKSAAPAQKTATKMLPSHCVVFEIAWI